ncbi:hypothetical protein [Flavobacterium denitrificans]|uniref:hypothetical protein n=1 Tax=Flavobacterium denitrificans TaxID=281361 RepID=UPI0004236D8E|nr:hypothetical protein [Flavobacterium denitrificans]
MEIGILGDHKDYIEEKFEEVLVRYNRFGKDLYNVIKEELPDVFKYLKYYRTIKYGNIGQLEDSYATYNDGDILFAIQLEPECEVICLYNREIHIEISDWNNNDYYKQSIEFIRTEFLNGKI